MNKKDMVELFKFLKSVYPQFEVDQYKIDTWSSLLSDQDFNSVMVRARSFAVENKFPPTLSELRVVEEEYSFAGLTADEVRKLGEEREKNEIDLTHEDIERRRIQIKEFIGGLL